MVWPPKAPRPVRLRGSESHPAARSSGHVPAAQCELGFVRSVRAVTSPWLPNQSDRQHHPKSCAKCRLLAASPDTPPQSHSSGPVHTSVCVCVCGGVCPVHF